MGLFTPNHGTYEVIFKAKTVPTVSWNEEKEQILVIEADDLADARRRAEKQIYNMGYHFYHICSARLIKRGDSFTTNSNRERKKQSSDSTPMAETSSGTSKSKKSGCLSFIVLILIILLIIGIGNAANKVEGTYYLHSISGTGSMVADKTENYLTLQDGTCTLHFTLIQPAGSEVLTFKYTGKTKDKITFEKDHVYMDSDGRVVIQLNFEDGTYNILTYMKK